MAEHCPQPQMVMLNASNYDEWAFHREMSLGFNDLLSYINGKAIKPDPVDVENTQRWFCKDLKARSQIGMMVYKDQMNYIRNAATAKEAWDALKEVHKPLGEAQITLLWRRLMATKKRPDQTMVDHLNEFTQVVSDLKPLNEIPSDGLLRTLILDSLPPEYEQFRWAIDQINVKLNLQELKVRILAQDKRLAAKNYSKEEAFATKSLATKTLIQRKRNEYLKKKKKTEPPPYSESYYGRGLKGVEAVAIHGGKDQEERSRSVEAFDKGEKDVLVATDVASKGLDFREIQHVVNYDMPDDIENYVHRIGRTGRSGKTGIATTFINKSCEESVLLDLKHLLFESKQSVPPFLAALQSENEKYLLLGEERGCSYCGGLGHRITDCPKLEAAQNKQASTIGRKDYLASNSADW